MTLMIVAAGRCQFCHRTAEDVEHILAGDSSFICSECVQACLRTLEPQVRPEASAAIHAARYVFQRLVSHFAPLAPNEVQATSRTFPIRQQADLQRALDIILGERRVPENFMGFQPGYRHEVISYSKLLQQGRNAIEVAPPQYEEIDLGRAESVRCLKGGVWLLREGTQPYAVILSKVDDYGRGQNISIEVAVEPGTQGIALSTRLFESLERQLSTQSCYRGRVLSLETGEPWSGHAQRIRIHTLDPVRRADLILPEMTLRTIERNILDFSRQRAALRALGQSTQKGLLFHGSPGTGKTHCIRYLAGCLEGHTTLLITAEQAGLLAEYMALARLLQPALIVIEDADLIARERTELANACDEVMLNRLLNELDGLRERADVFFILTTNRPSSLEPALVSRPGRIDQAIEFPLPDSGLRSRLITLYARGLPVSGNLIEELAARTEGASPAFIKELLRRVAQHHLEAGNPHEVSRATAESALHEMLFSGGILNKRLLGGEAVEMPQDRGVARHAHT